MAYNYFGKRSNYLQGGQFGNMQNLYPSLTQPTGFQSSNQISGGYPPHYQGIDYKWVSDMYLTDQGTRANQVKYHVNVFVILQKERLGQNVQIRVICHHLIELSFSGWLKV